MSGSHSCIHRNETVIVFPKQKYNVLAPSSYTHISARDLYAVFPGSVCLFCCRKITHIHMNVEIGTEDAQFPEKEYINGIFVAVFPLNSFTSPGPFI
jgi:hypothetical protein